MDLGADGQTGSGRAPFIAPPVEEMGRLFPQLELLGLIGQGGMGAVYRARQKELDRVVALKILPPDIGRDAAFAERFAREARALAKLNHAGIVTLYEFGRADGLFFFLMEFVDGVNLRQLLENGRLAPREALAIVPQICDALQYAHDQGIVHRDIKPENVLLDRRGRVKVADFGVAKMIEGRDAPPGRPQTGEPADPANLTDAGKAMGTPQYMAPEQRERPGEVDHRADIYALGVVFYQMLTGELPGKTIEPPSKKVAIDVRLDEVVLRALEKRPEWRYQQASILKTQVETIASTPGGSQASNEAQDLKSGAKAGPDEDDRRRKAMLWYGLIASVVGLPVGLALNLPLVWGLSVAGILIAGIKLGLLGAKLEKIENQQGNPPPASAKAAFLWRQVMRMPITAAFLVSRRFAATAAGIIVLAGFLVWLAAPKHPDYTMTGRITDSVTGDPVSQATLAVMRTDDNKPLRETTGDDQGRYRLVWPHDADLLYWRNGVRHGVELAIRASAPGYEEQSVSVTKSTDAGYYRKTLEIQLRPAHPGGDTSAWIDYLRLNPSVSSIGGGISRYGDEAFSCEILFDDKACAITLKYREEPGAKYRVQIEEMGGRRLPLRGVVRSTQKKWRHALVEEKIMMDRSEFDRVAAFVLQKPGIPPVGQNGFTPVIERTVEVFAPSGWTCFDLEIGQDVSPRGRRVPVHRNPYVLNHDPISPGQRRSANSSS